MSIKLNGTIISGNGFTAIRTPQGTTTPCPKCGSTNVQMNDVSIVAGRVLSGTAKCLGCGDVRSLAEAMGQGV